ncbi:MAG: COX15/CtaA family protein [Propionibacterium sp.]|nr:COX15/CtaA family protein [Propionibacterium sp.]
MDVLTPPATATRTRAADRWFATRSAFAAWALAGLIGNIVLVISGAIVRLTGSGLGCPTWPQCTDGSYVPRSAVNHHSLIEFGNRTLTFVLIILAVGTVVAALRSGAARRERALAWIALAAIPFQGVVGGITVLSKLNPWVVALHLLLSVALIVILTRLVMLTRGVGAAELPRSLRRLVTLLFWVLMVAIWLGTVVTGAGPNSGSTGAQRNHLDIETVARVHALSVWVAVGLTGIVLMQALRRGLPRIGRWAAWLLAAELLQGAIGYTQYFLGLPTWLVICHMAGIGLVVVAVAWLWFGTDHRLGSGVTA